MTLAIPLDPIPHQITQVTLAGQSCTIVVRQRSRGLFFDVYADQTPVVLGVLCLDRNKLVRYAYHGFKGDFVFYDAQGTSDPDYKLLGTRYYLLYLTPAEAG